MISKVIKISDSSKELKDLMNVLDTAGCSLKEKVKAKKIFKIYFNDKAEINKKLLLK